MIFSSFPDNVEKINNMNMLSLQKMLSSVALIAPVCLTSYRGVNGSHQAGLWLLPEDEGEDVCSYCSSAGLRLGLAGLRQGEWKTAHRSLC